MSWEVLETARCASCRVYMPKAELLFAADGSMHCVGCGVPVVHVPADPVDEPLGYRPPYAAVAGAMGLVTLSSWIAAWVSQL